MHASQYAQYSLLGSWPPQIMKMVMQEITSWRSNTLSGVLSWSLHTCMLLLDAAHKPIWESSQFALDRLTQSCRFRPASNWLSTLLTLVKSNLDPLADSLHVQISTVLMHVSGSMLQTHPKSCIKVYWELNKLTKPVGCFDTGNTPTKSHFCLI